MPYLHVWCTKCLRLYFNPHNLWHSRNILSNRNYLHPAHTAEVDVSSTMSLQSRLEMGPLDINLDVSGLTTLGINGTPEIQFCSLKSLSSEHFRELPKIFWLVQN
ncbi:unnamed protein product [Hymenolepis diminuta]|uniref:Uncharacterized protein n=1 Tax=Hymenolepis diminuta TaxID=6216 RepID=A0A564XV56_HYMDI|nr:unnamed protein product [Hymenolepis diminuta]